ncbi:unnamed protein product [Hymenolepis diminuta]|uniref:Complex III assembly factor LYRM7 n=1 Tax=Hymenolepis diminuta TaxID=6216 RepID=A0A564YQ62_HYMDI|nr:unnamed protein product [Hymenolepis diminuta]
MQQMAIRKKSLDLFRKLHRTRQVVFKGDDLALCQTKKRINDEFRKNKDVTDQEKLNELWKFGEDVNLLLRKTVVQCVFDEESRRFSE